MREVELGQLTTFELEFELIEGLKNHECRFLPEDTCDCDEIRKELIKRNKH